MTRKNSLFLLILITLFAACTNDPLDVDASEVKVDIAFVDVNEVIMKSDSADLIKKHIGFKKDITNIYAYLIGYCMEIGEVSDTAFFNGIKEFRADTTIQKLNGYMNKLFSDKKDMEANIVDGFKHLRYHLPKCKVPTDIAYMNTLFRSGVFCTEEEIGVGMQQYLGPENEVVKKLDGQFYFDWMKKRFDVKYLERDVLTGWIETHCIEQKDGDLAEQIIRWGKILYLTEAAYPDKAKHLILRYTEDELAWAYENESAFWKYLVDQDLLFKIDDRTTRNMVGDGPFTPGLPEKDGPDRLGQFIGWRMIHMYMEKNDVTVEEMIGLPYNSILQEYEIE